MISLTLTWKGQKPDKLCRTYETEEQLRLFLKGLATEIMHMSKSEDCDIRLQVEGTMIGIPRPKIGSIVKASMLDEKGRCCGRKPIIYKRPTHRLFCDRCCREYALDGQQISNWAYGSTGNGEFVSTYGDKP